jgi:hypothetical protein
MIALLLPACAPQLQTPADVGGSLPAEWIRAVSTDGHWQASFPKWPEIHSQPQQVQFTTEQPENVMLTFVQSNSDFGTFVVGSARQTEAVLAQKNADQIAELALRDTARRVEGTLGPIGPWEGVEGGVRADIGQPGTQVSTAAAVVTDGVLVLGIGSADRHEIIDAFLEGIHVGQGPVEPVDVALTDGVRARCPSVCGPLDEKGSLGGSAVPFTGFQGLIDHARYEMIVAPLRPGLDPTKAEEELRALFVSRLGGVLTEIGPSPSGGTRAHYTAKGGVGDVQTVTIGSDVVAAEVWSGAGGTPAWADAFLTSAAPR